MQVLLVPASEPTPPLPSRLHNDFPPIDDALEDEKTPIPTEAWPDFEPQTFPSEEIEPVDENATPATVEPAMPRAAPAQESVVRGPVAAVRVPQSVREQTVPTEKNVASPPDDDA